MIKKKVFIGSSSEELYLAQMIRDILIQDFDVIIWDEKVWNSSVFKINNNFLSDLLKASIQFDFGILIGTSDDKVIFRNEVVMQPRDNVLFELGLFIGRLGTSKCAFLIEQNVKLPSDLKGLTLSYFDRNSEKSIFNAVNGIKDMFLANNDDEVNFFPSTTLASVYFANLITPICRFIIENGGFKIDETLYKKCKVNVMIPDKIGSDVNIQFEQLKLKIQTQNVSFNYSGRPRNINIDSQISNGVLEFIEFPTIIAGIDHSISNILPFDFNKNNSEYTSILERELRRFISTLEKLITRNGFDEFVEIKRVNY